MDMETDTQFNSVYPKSKRLGYTVATILMAVLIAGFWNYHLVDDFGREVIAGRTIGNTGQLAGSYDSKGSGFGFIFAAVAGLAATFTACNCVVFAMIPGLACSTDGESLTGSRGAWKALGAFTAGVMATTGIYGVYVGFLGPEGIEVLNGRAVRMAQAQAVFTLLGAVMLVWGAFELGFLDRFKQRFSATTRSFFRQPNTKALLLGTMVGLFAVGRPFPVFREFLVYAASAQNPIYGAVVMMIQGIGQIAVMALLFSLVIWLGGTRLERIATARPYKFRMVSGLALIAGGTYFVYYWGLSFLFDIGRWGFKLGWYG